jgi:integrase
MSHVYITTRITQTGKKRYVVRYRLGGRGYRLIHAGSFATQAEARARRDLIAGELAAGRDPQLVLAALKTPAPKRTLAEWFDAFVDSRVDVSDATIRNYKTRRPRIIATLGTRDPFALTPTDAREWIGRNNDLKPSSLRAYYQTMQQILDHAGVDPNPFRDRGVKLPRREKAEIEPPDADQVLAILENVTAAYTLPLALIEQTGMRIGETVSLTWADVDVTGLRLRLRARSTKSSRARWAQVPAWLMRHLEDTCPLEDRLPSRLVFPGATEKGAYGAMSRACKNAKIPAYSPHDLRHRRATIWHHGGVPLRELQDRIGHASALLTLDWYTHAMPLTEVPDAAYERVLVRSW